MEKGEKKKMWKDVPVKLCVVIIIDVVSENMGREYICRAVAECVNGRVKCEKAAIR